MDPSINRRSVAYRGLLASLAVVAVLLFAHGGRDAEAVAVTPAGAPASEEASGNWNFERGDFTGWRTRSRGSGAWHAGRAR